MSKNIILCLDGTWNEPDNEDAAISKETNVRSLYEICVKESLNQIAHYDKGVGTEWYDKKLGGIHGWGLSKNVRQAYSYLSSHYEKGDRVFLFGFSRGAYTARSLSGLLFHCGLMQNHQNSTTHVNDIYNAYKDQNHQKMLDFKTTNIRCPIAFLGVWDTVGALGIPIVFLKQISEEIFKFHDTKLSPEVEFACHAVAIDEQRESFEPTLWEVTERNRHKIKQVWFAGVHSDVGGGYTDRHHSDVAFSWMLGEAKKRGLKIKSDHGYTFRPDLKQKIHNSYKVYFGKRLPRDAAITEKYKPKIHWSVREKMQLLRGYRPLALKNYIENNATLAPYEIEEEPVISNLKPR